MRALVVEDLAADYAGVRVKEIQTPQPGPGEVRLRVRAAAVNFPDLMQTRGEHQHKPALPFVGGMELAGEVDALGDGVTAFAVGDPVVGGARGCFSEFAVVPAAALRRKPQGLSFSQAAAYPVAYRRYDSLAHAFTAFGGAVPAADAANREIAGLVRDAFQGGLS